MPRGIRVTPAGMSITEHEQIAATLTHVLQELGQMRDRIREGFGSPSAPYVHTTQAMRMLKNVTHTLKRELLDEHSDDKPAPALIKIYREEG